METNAYAENRLAGAMTALGDAFDYAANDCAVDPDVFFDRFRASSFCAEFERGSPRVVSGMSGVELVRAVLRETEGREPAAPSCPAFARSPEFWCGWVLAYAQWRSGRRFSELRRAMSCADVLALYPVLHEAGPDTFADRMDERLARVLPGTRLSRLRAAAGLTQRALAARAGIGLRSLQMYEQRRKDVNRAEARTVRALALALGCRMEDVLEAAP